MRDGWLYNSASSNVTVAAAAERLRNQARSLCENNPYAAKFRRSWASNAVGDGIVASIMFPGQPQASSAGVESAWSEWVEYCDAGDNMNLYALQSMVAKSVPESGECLVRKTMYRRRNGEKFRLRLQVLEPDYIDTYRNEDSRSGAGFIRRGLQYDSFGRKQGYWLFQEHPGESGYFGGRPPGIESVFVPSSDVCHVFTANRPGQERGISWFAPVILRTYDAKDYEEAEIARKRIEACLSVFIFGNGDYDIGSPANGYDQNGELKREVVLEPGMVNHLPPGTDVKFTSPTASDGYADFMSVQLHAIAAGLGISYEAMTGDVSQVNFSSLRYGNNEYRRLISEFRWHALIPQMCQKIFGWWSNEAEALGLMPAQPKMVEWRPPHFESLDRMKDAAADLTELRMGKKSLARVIGEDGYSWRETLREMAEVNAELDRLGLKVDSDLREKGGASAPEARSRHMENIIRLASSKND
ncbi:MAG: phage portal protein [Geminicoccaceae bacterium]|nr:phage portal protein [Geminicoccaceae bacterium]